MVKVRRSPFNVRTHHGRRFALLKALYENASQDFGTRELIHSKLIWANKDSNNLDVILRRLPLAIIFKRSGRTHVLQLGGSESAGAAVATPNLCGSLAFIGGVACGLQPQNLEAGIIKK
jgi:hypothetical protein